MTPEQALDLLDKATQPNINLNRADYVSIHQALMILNNLLKPRPVKDSHQKDK